MDPDPGRPKNIRILIRNTVPVLVPICAMVFYVKERAVKCQYCTVYGPVPYTHGLVISKDSLYGRTTYVAYSTTKYL
jgi:hypothetical protein